MKSLGQFITLDERFYNIAVKIRLQTAMVQSFRGITDYSIKFKCLWKYIEGIVLI